MKLSDNAKITLAKRYLMKDAGGGILETPEQMLKRVAANIAHVDCLYYGKSEEETQKIESSFFEVMNNLEFLPNSPTLMNAGREFQQLSACFVLPIEDSIESIFETLKHMALVQKTGGGTGFAFDRLRPAGDFVKSTFGVASGPISFLKIYDSGTEAVKQGGSRRGASMGTLPYDHPDIVDFVTCKESDLDITNFNISVTVSDSFMEKVRGDDPDPDYYLVNPRTKNPHIDPETGNLKRMNARGLFQLILERAWRNGEPGIIFIDRMNEFNPTPHLGKYETSNPCGEQPLLPYEACCLGSINLGLMVNSKIQVDWDRLRKVVHTAVHFEDNVIDASQYAIPQITKMHQGNRKIGIGVMGWHDMLVRLGFCYDSIKALKLAEKVMSFINQEAKKKSVELALKRGVFPNFKDSIYDTGKEEDRVRNATRTTIAPTGTISIIAGASSGIEPYFSIAFARKNVLGGIDLLEVNPLFMEIAKRDGFYSMELEKRIVESGSVQNDKQVPEEIQNIFKNALEIDYTWHVRHQAAFQKYTDNAVSKTINLPFNASLKELDEAIKLSWKSGCKGITVYRNCSRASQVLNIGIPGKDESLKTPIIPKINGTTKKNCPECG
ncbi:adenosylcobalamin-dependent ribonucleoside-diphosphate reductase [Candidatus Contubernalis alkaliaceticus]|uniref:adenosylcobalamin-dependent ribonucleoside-diphosphate reductase n=1 Tax=Candidatus Contubernalis alkaliaceticus TaxID=338645 RepID=UPI001F4C4DCE|nr:adenosylcobalamin-dependent ribonucleoside-diphosphate reductase [Candidatus Contubernalis alkalaceticus]UNC92371.1 adenosylcobalamin-dependent ribonucleoside-diphosphate reductase [Candidatus Contubernalis alkalaceticus]